MRKLLTYISCLSLFLILGSCHSSQKEPSDEITIVTTTNILRSLVEAIAPEQFSVISIMKAGVDPHGYKASQGDLNKFLHADMIFYQGLYLEGKMIGVLEKLNLQIPTREVSKTIPAHLLIKDDDFHEAIDPHVWFSVPLWKLCAQYVGNKLIEQYPEHETTIKENTTTYLKSLDELHHWALEELSTIPKEQKILISAHDAFSYLGRDYDLSVYSLQGISTLSDFGLKSLKEIGDVIIEKQVPAFFLETSVSDRSIMALISGVKQKGYPIKTGGTLYSDSLGPKGSEADNYFTMFRFNITTIAQALKN